MSDDSNTVSEEMVRAATKELLCCCSDDLYSDVGRERLARTILEHARPHDPLVAENERLRIVAEAAQEYQDSADAVGMLGPNNPDEVASLHRRREAVHALRDSLYNWRVNRDTRAALTREEGR